MKKIWERSVIGRSSKILSKTDRKKVIAVVLLQISFGLLDLIGVGIIGIIGALAISGIEAQQPGNRVSAILTFVGLDSFSLQTQAAVLGGAAALLLVGKTIFSVIFTRKILFFLSRRGAQLSSILISKLFSQSLLTLQSKSMNEMMYSVTSGVNIITVGVLGTTVSVISDVSLLLVMSIGLFFIDPSIALSSFLIFGVIGLLLYRLMHLKARVLGLRQSELSIQSGEKVLEVIGGYREIVVRNRREYYAREIGMQRLELADVSAEMSFMPNISKYVIEVTVVVGSLIITGIQFLTHDATHAVAVLSIFLAASTRIAPAVLRIQQGAISVKSSLGAATPTLSLIETLSSVEPILGTTDDVDVIHQGFIPEVQLRNISFTYPGKSDPTLKNLNLTIEPGSIVALVGPSGAGKTTLVDVLLGVLPTDNGHATISGLTPSECVRAWPGSISYVPQDVMISNTTIKGNVAMGYPQSNLTEDLVWSALQIAQLSGFVEGLKEQLETKVGDRGTKISGGQRQRLGIARAMFTKPLLLVLDEATSSLDGETEANISDAIQAMRGSVTVVMIAHRLATVRHADKIVYMDKGEILAEGTFEEVRKAIPDFERQAQMMGL